MAHSRKPAHSGKLARPRKSTAKKTSARKSSARVTRHSDALDLEKKVFTRRPREIARSLKRSAERSHRRKSSPYRSAMSMLTFYINRGGKNPGAAKRQKPEAAKGELRDLFGRK